MSKNNVKLKEGEWIKPSMADFKMVCCDCGLVHSINFMVIGEDGLEIPNAKVIFQAFRDEQCRNKPNLHTQAIWNATNDLNPELDIEYHTGVKQA